MNYSMISYILGWIFNFEAAFMILPGITAIIYREKNGLAFLITMLICLTIGILSCSYILQNIICSNVFRVNNTSDVQALLAMKIKVKEIEKERTAVSS